MNKQIQATICNKTVSFLLLFLATSFIVAQDTIGWKREYSSLSPAVTGIAVIDYSIVDANSTWAIVGLPNPDNGELSVQARANLFLRTTDGGKNWNGGVISAMPSPYTPVKIEAKTADSAFVWAMDLTFEGDARLYVTSDGGKNWNENITARCTGQAVLLHFFSRSEGVVVSNKMAKETKDGGETWTKIADLPQLAPDFDDNFAINAREVRGDCIYLGSTNGFFYLSYNRGKTWTMTQLPLYSDRGSSSFRVIAIAMEDPKNGLALGSTFVRGGGGGGGWTDWGNCFFTKDSGKTWENKYWGGSLGQNPEAPKSDITWLVGRPQTYVLSAGNPIRNITYTAISKNRFDNFDMIDSKNHFCSVFKDSLFGYAGMYVESVGDGIGKYAPFYLNGGMSVLRNKNISISAYPNPSKGLVTVQNPKLELKSIIIYDELGKIVFSENISNKKIAQCNLFTLSNGIYFLRAEGKRNYEVQRIILNK